MEPHVLALSQYLKILPEIERNLEVARNFVAQLQTFRNAVVAFRLPSVLGVRKQSQARQFVGRNEAALDTNGTVGQLMVSDRITTPLCRNRCTLMLRVHVDSWHQSV